MGWLWSSGASSDAARYKGFDPDVRQALAEEGPSRAAAPSVQTKVTQSEVVDHIRVKPEVPPESLFQDGRYAHLWKNYQPLAEIEASDVNHDKLSAVIEVHKERQAHITRTALENCVFYREDERNCLANGSFQERLTMCKSQTKASNRCYVMQSRFLKALGYAGTGTTESDNENIQLHAETLYNRMLEREQETAQAKAAGLPEPAFSPLFHVDRQQQSSTAAVRKEALQYMGEEKFAQFEAAMSDKPAAEKELELQLIIADAKSVMQYSGQVGSYFEEERLARAKRREKGQETFGDTLKRWGGWNQ